MYSKISPCFVHFREAVLFDHMRMMYHLRAEGCYQSQMLHGGIVTTLDAQRCKIKNKSEQKEKIYNNVQIIPCNARCAPSAPSGTGGRQRMLPRQLYRRSTGSANESHVRRRREGESRAQRRKLGEGEEGKREAMKPPCGRRRETSP